jgi:mersacidin/lichenicidin family type 2 lantibiotic
MSKDQIIRAWKDPEYRSSLSPAQQARIPENPAGFVDLADVEMQAAVGGSLEMAAGARAAAPMSQYPGCSFDCQTRWILCKA